MAKKEVQSLEFLVDMNPAELEHLAKKFARITGGKELMDEVQFRRYVGLSKGQGVFLTFNCQVVGETKYPFLLGA